MQMEAYGASVKANNPINWESDILRGSIFQKWRKDRDFPSGPVAGLYRPVQGVQVWFLVGSYDPTCLVAKTPKHKKRKEKKKKNNRSNCNKFNKDFKNGPHQKPFKKWRKNKDFFTHTKAARIHHQQNHTTRNVKASSSGRRSRLPGGILYLKAGVKNTWNDTYVDKYIIFLFII